MVLFASNIPGKNVCKGCGIETSYVSEEMEFCFTCQKDIENANISAFILEAKD